jgi:hypothetical protein
VVFSQDRVVRLACVPNDVRAGAIPPEVAAAVPRGRCAAAHEEDARPCEGAIDAVQIVDQTGVAVAACLLHGAVLLASLDRARVYPLNGPEGSAITVFARARTLPPFDFEDVIQSPGGESEDEPDPVRGA